MGKAGKAIVKTDVKELLDLLNKALADEWLAYYQYWVGSKLAKGRMRPQVVSELVEHAEDELRHANQLAKRIIELGGKPIIEPKEWYNQSNCGYAAPTDSNTVAILKQNIEGERCAIGVYTRILDIVSGGKDPVTFGIVLQILKDEVEHEDDLEAILEDMEG